MAATEDTEITLGVGKMLALFFGLVALCGVFFGLGFTFGKTSVKLAGDAPPAPVVAANPGAKPAADASSHNMGFYKAVADKQSDASLSSTEPENTTAPATTSAQALPAESSHPVSAAASAAVTNGYYVQVAAVTKQEDAEALIDALKKKQYPAFSATNTSDKLMHVQVGPFAEIKDAEAMRSKLISDGYNPIVKR